MEKVATKMEARESHLIGKAMTLESNGLNHRDELL